MLVVSDASPINVLIRIGHIQVLEPLFEHVLVPPAVAEELNHPNTPMPIREWFSHRPAWLEIRAPLNFDLRAYPKDP